MQLAQEYLISIIGKLTHLVNYVQISNGAGFFDVNNIAEDFYCKLLAKIYDYKELENLNDGKKNIAAIDLGDKDSGVCYQITSENTTTKVHESIQGFIKNEFYTDYKRLIILIIVSKHTHSKVSYDTKGYFSFDKDNDVKDISDLMSDITHKHTSNIPKLQEINEFLNVGLGLVNSTKELTLSPNIAIEKIIGREKDIFEIQKKLNEATTPILLKGIGGIGKSCLAKVILQLGRYKYNNLVWVNAALGIREAFINNKMLLSNLSIEFSESDQIEDRFDFVLNKLRNLQGGLLVIDNALIDLATQLKNIPYNSNWKVLITSRVEFNQVEPYKLKGLSDEDAIELFYSNYSIEKDDAIVLRILKYINNHTLTIELLSKTADKRKLSLAKLDEQLIRNGLNIESRVKVATDHSSQETEYAFIYLSKIFDISEIGVMEENLLRHFSVISTDQLTFSQLNELFSIEESQKDDLWEGIEELVTKGWLSKDVDNNYSIHPVIQEVVRYILKPTLENCIWIFNSLRRIEFINHSKAYVDYFLKLEPDLKVEEPLLGFLLSDMATIYYDIYDYKNAIYYQSSAIKIFEISLGDDNPLLPGLLNQYFNYLLKDPHFGMKALEIQQRAFDLTKQQKVKLGSDLSDNEYLVFYYNRANVYISFGLINDADTLFKEADQLLNSGDKTDFNDFDKIGLLNFLGRLSILKQDGKDLKYFSEAVELIEKKSLFAGDFILIMNNLAGAYFRSGLLDKALDVSTRCIDYIQSEKITINDTLGKLYNTMALIFSEQGDWELALKYQDMAIEILTNFLGEDHYDVAINFSNKGSIYGRMLKFDEALVWENKALEIRLKRMPNKSLVTSESHLLMALYYLDINNANDALTYCENALNIYLNYAPIEILNRFIDVHELLGMIYLKQEDQMQAIKEYQTAMKYCTLDSKYHSRYTQLGLQVAWVLQNS